MPKSVNIQVLLSAKGYQRSLAAFAVRLTCRTCSGRASFEVDLANTEHLAARLVESGQDANIVLVAESGIGSSEDIDRLERCGAAGFLVGESLMRQPHPGDALRVLRGEEAKERRNS